MMDGAALNPESWLSPEMLPGTLKFLFIASALSLVPALLMMTTCFVRIAVVLGLLRQALGTQQLLPNQVMTGLAVFLTFMVMWPIWREGYEQGIRPYSEAAFPNPAARSAGLQTAIDRSVLPVRRFMSSQIEATGNEAAIDLFLDYQNPGRSTATPARYYEDVPLSVLIPAYVLSELKTAFLIGFQIYLPFLVIDLVIGALLSGMGLVTVSPQMVVVPCKLLLFVAADGWFLVVQLLLDSLTPLTG
jgi:flagellar biosynthetic protein FliP